MSRKRQRDDAKQENEKPEKVEPQSLYDVLGVDSKATHEEIRKAYHKLALRLHPDKNPNDESAKEKFQTLQKVFSVLGDKEKRKIYDATGSTEDDDLDVNGKTFGELYEYYRTIYKSVSVDDIISIENEYRGSKEEMNDLFLLYNRFDGNMTKVFAWLICSRPEMDSHRFMHQIDSAIEKGDLSEFKIYRKWTKKISKKPEPSNPLEKTPLIKDKKAEDDLGDLKSMILAKQAKRSDSLLASLEAKYCSKSSKGKKASSSKKAKTT